MKRILTIALSLVLALTMAFGLVSCGDTSGDYMAIKEKGFFVCGVTVYEPMNYKDDAGEWTGFDTEFAIAVAKELGLNVKFQEIDWPSKYVELNSGNIDLIWNGFTYGNESDGKSRTEYVDFTYSYLENKQVVITKADRVDELNTVEAFKGLTAVVEGGSSGEGVAKTLTDEDKVVKQSSQAKALMELASGNADFAVIDFQMANSMVGQGDYTELAVNNAYVPESEVYAIGARKGSDFTEEVNKAIKTLSENGTLKTLAEKYGLENDLIANIGA